MTESSPEQKSMGIGMLIAAWVVLLLLLAAYFGGFLESRYNPNQNPAVTIDTSGAREVRLAANHQNHYVADGAINGEPVTFLVDTGATDVVIPAGLAEKMRLKAQGQGWAETANGRVQVYRTTLDSLTIGNITLRNIRASINPGMRGDTTLLGMSALRHLHLRQEADVLVLSTQPRDNYDNF